MFFGVGLLFSAHLRSSCIFFERRIAPTREREREKDIDIHICIYIYVYIHIYIYIYIYTTHLRRSALLSAAPPPSMCRERAAAKLLFSLFICLFFFRELQQSYNLHDLLIEKHKRELEYRIPRLHYIP